MERFFSKIRKLLKIEKSGQSWEEFFRELDANSFHPFNDYPIGPCPNGGYSYICPDCLKCVRYCTCDIKMVQHKQQIDLN